MNTQNIINELKLATNELQQDNDFAEIKQAARNGLFLTRDGLYEIKPYHQELIELINNEYVKVKSGNAYLSPSRKLRLQARKEFADLVDYLKNK